MAKYFEDFNAKKVNNSGISDVVTPKPISAQLEHEEKLRQKKYLERLIQSGSNSERVQSANTLVAFFKKCTYVNDRLVEILIFESEIKNLPLIEGRVTLIWVYVTALFLRKEQVLRFKEQFLSDAILHIYSLINMLEDQEREAGWRRKAVELFSEAVTLRRYLETVMDGWWESERDFYSMLYNADQKFLRSLGRLGVIDVPEFISGLELKFAYRHFHPTSVKCNIIELELQELPQLINEEVKDLFGACRSTSKPDILRRIRTLVVSIMKKLSMHPSRPVKRLRGIVWNFCNAFNLHSDKEDENQICRYLIAILWTYTEIAQKHKIQRNEFRSHCTTFDVLLDKVEAATFTQPQLDELTAIRQRLTPLILGSWTQKSEFDEMLLRKGLAVDLNKAQAKTIEDFYDGSLEPDRFTILRLTAKLKVAAARRAEEITGTRLRDSLEAEDLSKRIVVSLQKNISEDYCKVHGREPNENVKLMDDIISTHLANFKEGWESDQESGTEENSVDSKGKESANVPPSDTNLKKLSYIEQLGTEIYEACEKESLSSQIGQKIRVLVIVITEELQTLRWNGSESHVEGCKRIQSLLKTFRDIPPLRSKARKYTLIVLWIYHGVVQSYRVTEGAWGEHWRILRSLLKRHFGSGSQNKSYTKEMRTVKQYFNLTMPQSNDKLNTWLKKSFPDVEWTKEGTEFPGRNFESFYGFDKDRTTHFFAVEEQAANMASDKSGSRGLDKAEQDSTLQRWIERVLWRNVSDFSGNDKASFQDAVKKVDRMITNLLSDNKGFVDALLHQEEKRWESFKSDVLTQQEIEEKSLLPPLDEIAPSNSSDLTENIGESIETEDLIEPVEEEETYKTVLLKEFSVHEYVEHLLSPTMCSHTVKKEQEKLSVVFRHSYSFAGTLNSHRAQDEESTMQSKEKDCKRKRLSKSCGDTKRLSKQFIL